MLTRRDFLRFGALAAPGVIPAVKLAAAPLEVRQAYFGIHPFIESNPKAVFIRRTHVASITDEEAKQREGLALAREIFIPMDKPGIPISQRIILKPNASGTPNRLTHARFYEGVVTALKEIGLKKFYCLEANQHPWVRQEYGDVNQRLGVQMNKPGRSPEQFRESWDMTWSTVPDGVVFKRIPHYAPLNEPDTWLLNIAKWKSHGMGMSLSVKNEQGLVVLPFCRFCSGWGMVTGAPPFMQPDIQPNAKPVIQKFFERHVKEHYDRYNSQAQLGPMIMEIWAQKTCDHMTVMKTGMAMVEGITAVQGFSGPQQLTNMVMFSKDKFRLDAIGMYLGGHEPGNINLFRIAKERGLTDTFDPWEIPIYEWVNGGAVRRKLTDFKRTPVKTYYLQLPGEPRYHLVDEPFDYHQPKA